ncbi:T9SS type A sorting domain-containing protein [Flagellimonas sediminis]|uniref:T9SS type A sorting domain-containing protein n=1 Tax=Flagellimonas sediminis TaxID=2696468 RepID=A0A6I5KLR3_9FLAO|nr:T9SS type A sorting domain-containing protein [Allomuricauda sediminis]NDV41744.1 T9SS type A sorting domain-containing protein [Allomuricauda sediminis]
MKHFYLVIFFFVCALGFSQENAKGSADIDGFKLYPNPVTQGKVYIETSLNSPKKILVFDVLGTQVLETTILGKELNLSNLDKGVYILRVFENNKVATRKLIIK